MLKTTIFGAIIAIVCCYKGMTASGGAEGVGRAVNQAVVISFLGIGAFNYVFTQTLLATHPQILVIKMNELLAVPREWLASTGEIARFAGNVVRDVWGLRVFRFFGETLRQSGILIICSTLVIWGLVFITGLGTCGIEGGLLQPGDRARRPTRGCSRRGATCARRCRYVFGYMMSAKVGTGIVAELGAMRISDEIDALEVMGIDSMTFLCATRLLAAWLVLPFMYIGAIGVAFLASYIAVVHQVGFVSSGGYLLIFWQFQNPADFLFSVIKGMTMATA